MQSIAYVALKEYVVTVLTLETDEHGAPWERKMNVVWDAGITPDWDSWLASFNELEDEPYQIDKVKEVDPDALEEM
ncbi:MAG: hypothetical protein ACRC11_18120 [Xenococcaceae cyanobacterium]